MDLAILWKGPIILAVALLLLSILKKIWEGAFSDFSLFKLALRLIATSICMLVALFVADALFSLGIF